jgi:hypothetical protein
MGILVTSKRVKTVLYAAFTALLALNFLYFFRVEKFKNVDTFCEKDVSEKSLRIFWQ